MDNVEHLTLKGRSGRDYIFEVYPLDSPWNQVAALYVVLKAQPNPQGGFSYSTIRVAETSDLRVRHNDQHKQGCFRRHGANRLGVILTANDKLRKEMEADLLEGPGTWPCNG